MSESAAVQDIPEDAKAVEPRKPTKLELKRQQIFQDRMKRKISDGLTPEQAYAAIQKEDWERLPADKKIAMMQVSFSQSLENVGRDLARLHDNQKDLADVMDVNFRAYGKMFVRLGIPDDEQVKMIKECEDEVRVEREAFLAQQAVKQKAEAEEAQKKELAETVDQPGETKVPDGATVFGG